MIILTAILSVLSFFYFKLSDEINELKSIKSDYTVMDSTTHFDIGELETDIIHIATGYYPPYVYESNGRIVGMDYEILTAVLQDMDAHYRLELMSWASGVHELDTGGVYAVFPYAKTSEREKSYVFSEKFYDISRNYNYYTFKGNDASGKINSIEDLRKFRVGAVSGYFYIDMFDKLGIKYEICSDEKEALTKLKQNRIDVLPMNVFVAGYIIENDFSYDADKFEYSELELSFEGVGDYLMLNKENPQANEFIEKFNKSLEKLKENGTISEITQRYMEGN